MTERSAQEKQQSDFFATCSTKQERDLLAMLIDISVAMLLEPRQVDIENVIKELQECIGSVVNPPFLIE